MTKSPNRNVRSRLSATLSRWATGARRPDFETIIRWLQPLLEEARIQRKRTSSASGSMALPSNLPSSFSESPMQAPVRAPAPSGPRWRAGMRRASSAAPSKLDMADTLCTLIL